MLEVSGPKLTHPDLFQRIAHFAEYASAQKVVGACVVMCVVLGVFSFAYVEHYEAKSPKTDAKKLEELTSGANQIVVEPSFVDRFKSSSSTAQAPVLDPPRDTARDTTNDRSTGQSEVARAQLQQEIAKRSEEDRVSNMVVEVEGKINDVMNSAALFEQLISNLSKNDDGRRIASDARLLEPCIDVLAGRSLTKEVVLSLQDKLYTYKRTLTTVGISSKELAGTLSSLSSLKVETERMQREFEIASKTLDRWIAVSSSNTPSKETLQEIIDQRESDRFVKAARENRLKIDAEKDKLEAVKTNIEIAKVQTEEKKRQDELGLLREKEKVRTAEQNKQLAILKLQQDFENDWLEMQSLLAPFISEGNSIVGVSNNNDLEFLQTTKRQLVSLSAIQSSGALNDSVVGFERLLYIANHSTNKRNKGTFPIVDEITVKRDPRVRQKLVRVQELLSKYGDILIEKGLLKN